MNPIVRNIIAAIAGLVVGNLVMVAMIIIGPKILPLPNGIDPMNMEALKQNVGDFSVGNYALSFLAHALGTFAGAFVAVKAAASHHKYFALGIALFFLIGGIMMTAELPTASNTFKIIDILCAYLPMGMLAYILGRPRNVNLLK